MNNKKKIYNNFISKNFIFFLILILSSFFRLFNLSNEDLWVDEMISFWVANPSLTLIETLKRNFEVEFIPFFYNVFLKYQFKIFGYDPYIGKFFNVIFSILTIIVTYFISKNLNKKSALFSIILVGFNIYLIKYSQELRVYSLFVLLSSLSYLFFYKLIDNKQNKSNILFFLIFQILCILCHPFGWLIFFSIFFYIIFEKAEYTIKIIYLLIPIFVVSFIYYLINFLNLYPVNEYPSWVWPLNLKFFTNFYFSKFFGSRILGLIYLIFLIISYFIILRNRSKNVKIMFFIYLIFVSYVLPIIFGLIFKDILIDRYLIFLIIPIILTISYQVFTINSFKYRFFSILIFLMFTVGNFITENTFKSIYSESQKFKPEFLPALKSINDDDVNHAYIVPIISQDKNLIRFNNNIEIIYEAYIKFKIKKYKINMNLINDVDSYSQSTLWVFCHSNNDCSSLNFRNKFEIIQTLNFNKITIKKLKFL
jgi:hypothetical protein